MSYRWKSGTGTQVYLLRKNAANDNPFAFWGWYASGIYEKNIHLANGSARDAELFLIQQR